MSDSHQPKSTIEILINLWSDYISKRFVPGKATLVFMLGMEGYHTVICQDKIPKNAKKGGVSFTDNYCDETCNKNNRLNCLKNIVPSWMLFSTFAENIRTGVINTDNCPDIPGDIDELEAQSECVPAEEGIFREFNMHVLVSIQASNSSHIASLRKQLKNPGSGGAEKEGGGDKEPKAKNHPLLNYFCSSLKTFLNDQAAAGSLGQSNSHEVYEALRYFKGIKSVTLNTTAINDFLLKGNPPPLPSVLNSFYNNALVTYNASKNKKKSGKKPKKDRTKASDVGDDDGAVVLINLEDDDEDSESVNHHDEVEAAALGLEANLWNKHRSDGKKGRPADVAKLQKIREDSNLKKIQDPLSLDPNRDMVVSIVACPNSTKKSRKKDIACSASETIGSIMGRIDYTYLLGENHRYDLQLARLKPAGSTQGFLSKTETVHFYGIVGGSVLFLDFPKAAPNHSSDPKDAAQSNVPQSSKASKKSGSKRKLVIENPDKKKKSKPGRNDDNSVESDGITEMKVDEDDGKEDEIAAPKDDVEESNIGGDDADSDVMAKRNDESSDESVDEENKEDEDDVDEENDDEEDDDDDDDDNNPNKNDEDDDDGSGANSNDNGNESDADGNPGTGSGADNPAPEGEDNGGNEDIPDTESGGIPGPSEGNVSPVHETAKVFSNAITAPNEISPGSSFDLESLDGSHGTFSKEYELIFSCQKLVSASSDSDSVDADSISQSIEFYQF